MKIKPLKDRVLLKLVDPEEKTASGLSIPKTAQEKTLEGVVVELGEDQGFSVKAGDKVMYNKHAGTPVKIDGVDHLIIDEDDIIAIVEG